MAFQAMPGILLLPGLHGGPANTRKSIGCGTSYQVYSQATLSRMADAGSMLE